jgi:uncharacterized protein YpmB
MVNNNINHAITIIHVAVLFRLIVYTLYVYYKKSMDQKLEKKVDQALEQVSRDEPNHASSPHFDD